MNKDILQPDDFKDRAIDQVDVAQSKKFMWQHIKSQTSLGKNPATAKATATSKPQPNMNKQSFFSFFASLISPKKIAWASVIATVTLVAVIFGPNLQNLIKSGQLQTRQVVSAHFEMEADDTDSAGIDGNSTFTLTSSEDYDEGTIAENLIVSPETELAITKTAEGIYTIDPVDTLDENRIYNFTIISETETGEEEFSWAYQVKETFKITGTLPGDKTSGVPLDTGIEFYFSHEQFDAKTANEYLQITPTTPGHFEKHQRALVFIPDTKLNPGTIYEIAFKAGFTLDKSDLSLTEETTFQFETTEEDDYVAKTGLYFSKDSYEVGLNTTIALTAYEYGSNRSYDDDEGSDAGPSIPVEIYKFNTEDDFQNALIAKNDLPYWANYANRNFAYDKNNITHIGSFDGFMDKANWQSFIYLPAADLAAGQYLLQANNGNDLNQTILQITDLSTYQMVSETYSIMWVNDLATKSPVNKAKTEIIGTDKSFETNAEGIGKFTLTKKDHVENYVFKTTTPDGKTLFSRVNIPAEDSIYSDYWYDFVTDRPMYQPEDTVQFWSYIKPRNARVNIDDLNISLYKGWYFNEDESFVADIPFEIIGGDTFSGSYKLADLPPGSYNLVIKNGDKSIANESITIENYAKPTYDIELTADKEAVFAGEIVNFDLKTNFFDGTPVPNMQLTSYTGGRGLDDIITDGNGEAAFDLTAQKAQCTDWRKYCYDTQSMYVNIEPKLAEDVNINASENFRVFNSHITLDANATKNEETGMINIEVDTHWITLDRLNNETNEGYYDYLADPAVDRPVIAGIKEVRWEKYESGQHYDFINKKVVKDYKYNRIENWLPDVEMVTDQNGHATYSFHFDDDKYYQMYFKSWDNDGNETYNSAYIYGGTSPEQGDYYSLKIIDKDLEDDVYAKYDIGENVEIEMRKGESPISEDAGGQFLFIQQLNGLQDYDISDQPYYDFKFANEHVPGLYLNGVWFDGTQYRVTYDQIVYFNYDAKKLNIEVSKNKEKYEPGEEVTLNVKVTDIDGKPVSAYVNLNLVDEAYYKLVYSGKIDTLHNLYSMPGGGVISTKSSHVNPEAAVMDSGKGGCFTGETQILMSDETYKSIAEIVPGDVILTKENEYSAQLVPGTVMRKFVHKVDKYMIVNEMLEVTPEHIMMINGVWQVAGNLKFGDMIFDKDGNMIEVKSLRLKREPVTVYNFEVEKYHTYFANDIYVHNDKGGDGIRNEFEDTALFRTIQTSGNGEGEVKFQVPDNITSWRVTAQAIDGKNLRAGSTASEVIATLPVFGDLVMNKEYSVKDLPVVLGRAYGDEISAGDETTFALIAKSLEIERSADKTSNAFDPVYFNLGELTLGEHDVILETKANGKEDKLQETIEVKGSRLKQTIVEYVEKVENANDLKFPQEGMADIYFIDAGIAKFYGSLLHLYSTNGDRLDQKLSEIIAIDLLESEFDQKFAPQKNFDPKDYQHETNGGLMLLPYSESDLRLSAIISAVETSSTRYREKDLKKYFYSFYRDTEANLEEITLSLLGLASMNEPVLQSLKQIQNEPELTLTDKLYIGLAFANLGDKQNAKTMFTEVEPELKADNGYETALGAMLAAAVQEREAASELWVYVLFNGIEDDILNLYEIGYLKHAIKYVSHDPVKFKLEIDGAIQTLELEQCKTHGLIAGRDQDIKISNIEGDLAAVIGYDKIIEPEDYAIDESIQISRTYMVNGEETNNFYEGDMVQIVLNIEGEKETGYHVTDVMPSGLKLMTTIPVYGPYRSLTGGGDYPYAHNGQEVSFYAYTKSGTKTISYNATVVNPGEFYADPAKIESYRDLSITNISKGDVVLIEKHERPTSRSIPTNNDLPDDADVNEESTPLPPSTENALVEIETE
jgi:Pretoxin HINT domain/Alpha-2-macroglobulin bait region domain/Bacterial Alpha-2-macroglobulin MG10 domain/Bacterial Ig-like domain/Alpha-2-macroglobulin family